MRIHFLTGNKANQCLRKIKKQSKQDSDETLLGRISGLTLHNLGKISYEISEGNNSEHPLEDKN